MLILNPYPGRAALQQRVLPSYRAPLFDRLAAACTGGLSVLTGLPQPAESIQTSSHLDIARFWPAVNRHFLTPAHPLYLCWQAGILKWLADWDPEVLIAEANPRYPSTRRAVRWMHARSRPVIGWGLGAPAVHGPLKSLRAGGRLRFLQMFDALIAYSQRGAAEYTALGYPAGRIYVAANAVAPRPQHPPPKRDLSVQGPLQVLFVGRLQARKRIDNLLHACAALPVQRQPHLRIVGDGPDRTRLEALARAGFPPGGVHRRPAWAGAGELFRDSRSFRPPWNGRARGAGGHGVRPTRDRRARGWHPGGPGAAGERLARAAGRPGSPDRCPG